MPPRSSSRQATPGSRQRRPTPYAHDLPESRSTATLARETLGPVRRSSRGSVPAQDETRMTRSMRRSRNRGDVSPENLPDPEEILRTNRAASRQSSVVSSVGEPSRPQNQDRDERRLPIIEEADNSDSEEEPEHDEHDDITVSDGSGSDDVEEEFEEDGEAGEGHENVLPSIETPNEEDGNNLGGGVSNIFPTRAVDQSRRRVLGNPVRNMDNYGRPRFASVEELARSRSRSTSYYSAASRLSSEARSAQGSSQDPEPDSGLGVAVGQDRPALSFWWIYWQQIGLAWRYLYRCRTCVSLAISIRLLYQELCSAGPICEHFHWRTVFGGYIAVQPIEALCCVLINTLAYLDIWDAFVNLYLMFRRVRRMWTASEQAALGRWEKISTCLVRTGKEMVDRVAGPVCLVVLTLTLRGSILDFSFGKSTGVISATVVSLVLHQLKWLAQTCEIYRPNWGRANGTAFSARSLVAKLWLFLILLTVLHHWSFLMSFLSIYSKTSHHQAQDADNPAAEGARAAAPGGWFNQIAIDTATRAYQVTHTLVTLSITPVISSTAAVDAGDIGT